MRAPIFELDSRRMKREEKDFLEEIIEESSREIPQFPAWVDAAVKRRELLRHLAEIRKEMGLSQTMVAARMNTSQSQVVRLETGDETDPRLSTLEKYAIALGKEIEFRVKPAKAKAAAR